MPADERIERALGLLAGTVAAVAVFLASFFLALGGEAPPGLIPVFVTITLVLASIPGIIVNAVFAGLGMVASMGWLIIVLLPYLLVGSAAVAAVATLLGWTMTRVTARKLLPSKGQFST